MLDVLLDFLFPTRNDEKVVRAIAAESFIDLLTPKMVETTHPFTAGLLPFHTKAARAVIHEAKYHGNEKAFTLLASVLREYILESEEDMRNVCVVPIPLGKKRAQERGYNQVEEVAQRAAGDLGFNIEGALLVRVRETKSQVSLARGARIQNMRGAFGAAHSLDSHTLYMLLDDVVTTGATMQAAIDALKAGGATKILPIAFAY